VISYAKVLAALGPVRSEVLYAFKALGGDMNRWRREDWDRMAHAVTAAEDRVELDDSRKAYYLGLRHELRRVRRVLEEALA
jgi:hypothetical protein